MFLESAIEQEIIDVVKTFRNGVATGYDNIPLFAIKDNIDIIANPLTHLVNLSLSLCELCKLPELFLFSNPVIADCYQIIDRYQSCQLYPRFLKKLFITV